MLKIASRDQIISKKIERRKKIPELEYHSNGDCVHLGKISNGCRECFLRDSLSSYAIYTGVECNAKCGYCYYSKKRTDNNLESSNEIINNLSNLYSISISPKNNSLRTVTYNSKGETLKYLNVIKEAAKIIKRIEKSNNKKIYSHLYTNGILATPDVLEKLKEWGIVELRFHISASNFSKKVINNMKAAKKIGFVVSVEEPALPENKKKLLKHLPLFEKIGISHLNLIECQVTPNNYSYLEKKYPNGIIYRDLLWHLYDEGMVYDIIEEVIKKKYSFSVIDCNSRVECTRDAHHTMLNPQLINWSNMDGACLDFNDKLE